MSEHLLESLQASFKGRGIDVQRSGATLRAKDGLAVQPRVHQRGTLEGGTVQVQVDFSIESPRMQGITLLDSFAGLGETAEKAEQNAYGKFLQASFDVVAAALTTHRGDTGEADWEDWSGAAGAWRVCTGPVLMVSTREGAHIEGISEFIPRLADLFGEKMPAGPHWMRVFVGALGGKHTGSEVLVDGAVWDAGQALLDSHPWVYPQGYASFRYLLIALPRDA